MTATPTGHLSADRRSLQWERTLDLAPEEAWAAITDSDRMAAWIGEWTGNPADGFVMFAMTAEGDGPASRAEIRVCEPPHRYGVVTSSDFGSWHLELEVAATGEGSVVTMRHVIEDPAGLENIGPGWEYYLDRLVAAESGGDPASIVWDDYYPAQREHYEQLAASL